jgi:hypothetical protein
MTPRVFRSFMGALIRIGLLLALVILLMAENAQAQPGRPTTHLRLRSEPTGAWSTSCPEPSCSPQIVRPIA